MRRTRISGCAAVVSIFLCVGCSNLSSPGVAAVSAATEPSLGVRPVGDTTIQPDMSRVDSTELKQIFSYIDEHIDGHVANLQRWVRQPGLSDSGEGISDSADMVKGFFTRLGCQTSTVYDVGATEWGAEGHPVVYSRCDEGAPHTLLIYWTYDTSSAAQPDVWVAPPFDGRLVAQPPFPRVLIARGADSKGPQMAQWNALMSIKAVAGRLPVNLIVVAEGDAERMHVGLRQFMTTHADLFADAEALWGEGGQRYSGRGRISEGNSEGCVSVEISTSARRPSRIRTVSDRDHRVDSPAWRHIKAISSIVSDEGDTARIDGFYDDALPPSAAQLRAYADAAKTFDIEEAARNLGVARFVSDEAVGVLPDRRWMSFNLDGIWDGNMEGAGGARSPRILSKHRIRYVPNMKSPDLVEKLQKQLVKNGYPDAEVTMIGDVPWRVGTLSGALPRAQARALDLMQIPYSDAPAIEPLADGCWPAYLFSGGTVLDIPISNAGAGFGGNAHAANEFYVIEGAGKVYGMAGAEKTLAAVLYNFAGKN